MTQRILLLSSSTISGSSYLDYAESEIIAFLGDLPQVLFVPFALADEESYTRRVSERLGRMSYKVEGLHRATNPREAIERAAAIFIGGGNTFRLLKRLYDLELLSPIRERVKAGGPYLGSSAGSNVAAPTICTTNDMPIVQPPSFAALGLVPFQINPHYLDPDPASEHKVEMREERILQFLEENATPVIGLREGAWLRVEDRKCLLGGVTGARWFERNQEPKELAPGAEVQLG